MDPFDDGRGINGRRGGGPALAPSSRLEAPSPESGRSFSADPRRRRTERERDGTPAAVALAATSSRGTEHEHGARDGGPTEPGPPTCANSVTARRGPSRVPHGRRSHDEREDRERGADPTPPRTPSRRGGRAVSGRMFVRRKTRRQEHHARRSRACSGRFARELAGRDRRRMRRRGAEDCSRIGGEAPTTGTSEAGRRSPEEAIVARKTRSVAGRPGAESSGQDGSFARDSNHTKTAVISPNAIRPPTADRYNRRLLFVRRRSGQRRHEHCGAEIVDVRGRPARGA